jgi:hypothetical protein
VRRWGGRGGECPVASGRDGLARRDLGHLDSKVLHLPSCWLSKTRSGIFPSILWKIQNFKMLLLEFKDSSKSIIGGSERYKIWVLEVFALAVFRFRK